MSKFLADRCEVCGERVFDVKRLPPQIREKVYKPQPGEEYFIDDDMAPTPSFQGGNGQPLEAEIEIPEDF